MLFAEDDSDDCDLTPTKAKTKPKEKKPATPTVVRFTDDGKERRDGSHRSPKKSRSKSPPKSPKVISAAATTTTTTTSPPSSPTNTHTNDLKLALQTSTQLQSELSISHRQVESLIAENKKLKATLAVFSSRPNQSQIEEMNKLKKTNCNLQSRVTTLTTNLETQAKEILALKSSIIDEQNARENVANEVLEKRKEIAVATSAHEIANSKIKLMESEKIDLTRQIDLMKKEAAERGTESKRDIEDLTQTLKQTKTKLQNQIAHVSQLTSSLNKAKKDEMDYLNRQIDNKSMSAREVDRAKKLVEEKERETQHIKKSLQNAIRTKALTTNQLKSCNEKLKNMEKELEVSEKKRKRTAELVSAYKQTDTFRKKKMESKFLEANNLVEECKKTWREKYNNRERILCVALEKCLLKTGSGIEGGSEGADDFIKSGNRHNSDVPISPMSMSGFSSRSRPSSVMNSLRLVEHIEHAIEVIVKEKDKNRVLGREKRRGGEAKTPGGMFSSTVKGGNAAAKNSEPAAINIGKQVFTKYNRSDHHVASHVKSRVGLPFASEKLNAFIEDNAPKLMLPSDGKKDNHDNDSECRPPSQASINPFDDNMDVQENNDEVDKVFFDRITTPPPLSDDKVKGEALSFSRD